MQRRFQPRIKGQVDPFILSVKNSLTSGGSDADVGKPAVVSADNEFDIAADDDVFCGFIDSVKPGVVGIKIRGYMENVPYDTAAPPVLGPCMLLAAADNKVKAADPATEVAPFYTVTSIDETAETCSFIM